MARDNEEIRRLADKFSGRSTKEVMEDPEFQQLTAEDVEALAAEHGPTEFDFFRVGEAILACLEEARTVDDALAAIDAVTSEPAARMAPSELPS
jgi:hypothetical protein